MRLWQDNWTRAAGGSFEYRRFVERGGHSDFLSGIEEHPTHHPEPAVRIISRSPINAAMFERIKALFGPGEPV